MCPSATTTTSSSTSCSAEARQKCSANFDYAGPLTESVLIGNVAAHFPGETLAFDAQVAVVPEAEGSQRVPDADVSEGVGGEGVARALRLAGKTGTGIRDPGSGTGLGAGRWALEHGASLNRRHISL